MPLEEPFTPSPLFDEQVERDARTHARSAFPNEACGVVTHQGYWPCRNTAPDPSKNFLIPDEDLASAPGPALAVFHSHTNGKLAPSTADQQQQIASDIPWGISLVTGDEHEPHAGTIYWFGDTVWSDANPRPPLLGRAYRWGPTGTDGKGDCFALARDYYREKHGFEVEECPREAEFWHGGNSPYLDRYIQEGFKQVSFSDLRRGDTLLLQIRAGVPNHAAIYIDEGGLILHHLEGQVSCRTPLGRWSRFVSMVLRPPREEVASDA